MPLLISSLPFPNHLIIFHAWKGYFLQGNVDVLPHLSPGPPFCAPDRAPRDKPSCAPAALHFCHHSKGPQPGQGLCPCHLETLLCLFPHLCHPICPLLLVAAALLGNSQNLPREKVRLCEGEGTSSTFSTVSAPLPPLVSSQWGRFQPPSASLSCRASSSPLYHGRCLPRFGGWGAVPTAQKCHGQLLLISRPSSLVPFSLVFPSAWPVTPDQFKSDEWRAWSPEAGPGKVRKVRTV